MGIVKWQKGVSRAVPFEPLWLCIQSPMFLGTLKGLLSYFKSSKAVLAFRAKKRGRLFWDGLRYWGEWASTSLPPPHLTSQGAFRYLRLAAGGLWNYIEIFVRLTTMWAQLLRQQVAYGSWAAARCITWARTGSVSLIKQTPLVGPKCWNRFLRFKT
jgi:hypothetical protein